MTDEHLKTLATLLVRALRNITEDEDHAIEVAHGTLLMIRPTPRERKRAAPVQKKPRTAVQAETVA